MIKVEFASICMSYLLPSSFICTVRATIVSMFFYAPGTGRTSIPVFLVDPQFENRLKMVEKNLEKLKNLDNGCRIVTDPEKLLLHNS